MTFQGNIDRLVGREVVGSDGERIGDVGQVFVLEGTDEPTWITVRTGLFGMHESFIPVAGATERGDGLVVPFEKSFVKDAPRIDDASELSVEQEAELYRYYGVEPPMQQRAVIGEHERDARDRHDEDRDRGVGGHLQHTDERHPGDADDSGPSTAHADRTPYGGGHDAGSADSSGSGSDDERGVRGRGSDDAQPSAGGPRLRRRIVTEMQTIQVPVQREEIVVEGDGIEPDGDDRR
ncbi:PRC-barrel domain-containing protein [Agrococcus lahaulensis]|uniref:PRC-barrel domain-containing protein n=1 Tax=Agrococcus lahaulensis TaxID=341722 RepID=UPI000685834E|nr:PRC-barrel domain-containing protein [Agrococcus lahaulensis]